MRQEENNYLRSPREWATTPLEDHLEHFDDEGRSLLSDIRTHFESEEADKKATAELASRIGTYLLELEDVAMDGKASRFITVMSRIGEEVQGGFSPAIRDLLNECMKDDSFAAYQKKALDAALAQR